MRKILILNILILSYSIHSYSQNSYFAKDTLLMVGIKIIDGGSVMNSRICQVISGGTVINYSPYEVDEYGIDEDKIYVARDIKINNSTQRVFLEVLVKGKTNLYYYQEEQYRTFFISKDSIDLIEIPEKANNEKDYFRTILRNLTTDSPEVLDATYLVKYNKKAVTEFINRYNRGENKPFPFFKFGVTGGYELSKFSNPSGVSPSYLENIDYTYNGFLCFGLFADIPVMPTNFSVHLELYHSSHKYSETGSDENIDYDLVANQNSLKIPVLLRYYFYSGKINPYVNAGGILAYNYYRHANIFVTTIENKNIEIYLEKNAPVIPEFQFGFSAGTGIEWKINPKNALLFELRYNQLYGLPDYLPGNREIQFITGINF